MFTAILYYLLLVAIASVVAFAMYWLDKRLAQSDSRRISEKNLILVAIVGGWPGAWAAQQIFRHKTQKTSFQINFWLAVAVHVGMVGFFAYLFWWR